MKRIQTASLFPPIGQYSHAIEVPAGSRLLFISGQIGVDHAGQAGEGFARQVELALANLGGVLADAQADVSCVVQMTHYLVGDADLAQFRDQRSAFLGEARPCSTLLFVPRLFDTRFLYEVDAVAVVGTSPR
jgi:2-iminobutanoate/2-iminopropanoate deaminase